VEDFQILRLQNTNNSKLANKGEKIVLLADNGRGHIK
jgi:hypothetical protein